MLLVLTVLLLLGIACTCTCCCSRRIALGASRTGSPACCGCFWGFPWRQRRLRCLLAAILLLAIARRCLLLLLLLGIVGRIVVASWIAAVLLLWLLAILLLLGIVGSLCSRGPLHSGQWAGRQVQEVGRRAAVGSRALPLARQQPCPADAATPGCALRGSLLPRYSPRTRALTCDAPPWGGGGLSAMLLRMILLVHYRRCARAAAGLTIWVDNVARST
jgi:hypothetical protein